jgi:hypothetical protein
MEITSFLSRVPPNFKKYFPPKFEVFYLPPNFKGKMFYETFFRRKIALK